VAARHPADLFERASARDPALVPLAERMRPRDLGEIVGQPHLLGEGKMLRRVIEADRLPSMILWGPPGTGKTTVARIIAARTGAVFETLSATSSGVKDIRAIVDEAARRRSYERRGTVLFIDEIHRFHRGQQDALLPHVEAGVCTLIGATTENPSFQVNAPLRSRTRILQLRELEVGDIIVVLERALRDDKRGLGALHIEVDEALLEVIARAAQGDARRALCTLELAADLLPVGEGTLDADIVARALGRRDLRHDRAGEDHYNVVSAFIKSMRASDADAATYFLARMIEAGEDPMFVARRLVIFAAEDVGNADPQALVVAQAAADATHLVGLPEAVLPLTQATIYLSLAEKSNLSVRAYKAAREDVVEHGALPVPLEVRNAVTKMMKEAGYGQGYRYPHDEGGVVEDHDSYLPEELRGRKYVRAGDVGWEAQAARMLASRRKKTEGDP
jgi:putative ATPase